jgi:hypothetical protein
MLLNAFPPMGYRTTASRHNLDGFLNWTLKHSPDENSAHGFGYCQLYSHGAIESVDASSLIRESREGKGPAIIPTYESGVVDAISVYLDGYKQIGIAPPVAIGLSLLGCKGACMYLEHNERWNIKQPLIDRDAAILSEVVIESLDIDVAMEMKPIFDIVWNACGFAGSYNYREWTPRSR